MSSAEQQDTLQAAFRDASFWRHPDTRTVKMAHVLRADGSPACGLQALMGDPEPAENIQVVLRCKRSGCIERWPKNDPEDRVYFCQSEKQSHGT
ncbi:hypothetical protein EAH72_33405 [Pseudomonas caspiana]|nr:hypothetical protein [Pseudomonas caspiana]TPG88256.1 hypothetical protein EAH72_33405 [Pseudomonas caspiana]